ncbi:hypothetical protein BaRGS_00023043 [Batillaria attramentaria]|uniref:Ig-like domain-containing protein n=1 Tax=Batillaria attramentaria TaxID=370345 RepID=A0ABD0KFB2_9CAEN
MAAFPGRLGKLVAMQIVRDADGQGQTTLATADATGLSVMSPHLTTTRSLAIVRGGLQTNRRQSWLTLRMADAGASDYGDYSCRISYLEHPADTPPTIRQTDVISLGPHTASSSGSEQFRLTVTKGLDMSCSVPRDGNASFADSVKIFTEDTNVSVADWSREEAGQSIQNETSKNTRILQEHEVWEEDRGIFRAHLWDMSCVDEGNYLCSVEYRNKNVVRSPAQELPVDDCSSTPTVSRRGQTRRLHEQIRTLTSRAEQKGQEKVMKKRAEKPGCSPLWGQCFARSLAWLCSA